MQPQRFEDHRPFLLAGLRRHYGFAEGPIEIPLVWRRFVERLPLPDQVGTVTYGAMCGTDLKAERFEYICAAEVSSFDRLPADLGRMRVPAAHYAVFVHEGPISGIRHTWAAIHAWLAMADWKGAPTPDFERYGPGYDPVTGSGDTEVWVPVVPRG